MVVRHDVIITIDTYICMHFSYKIHEINMYWESRFLVLFKFMSKFHNQIAERFNLCAYQTIVG
jgi:hypothetical protein